PRAGLVPSDRAAHPSPHLDPAPRDRAHLVPRPRGAHHAPRGRRVNRADRAPSHRSRARRRPRVGPGSSYAPRPGGCADGAHHRIDGDILPVGTDAWALYMTRQLDTATEVLSARGARVVLLTSPCVGQPDSGLGGIPERSDPARLGAMNDMLRTYAKGHSA